MTTPHTPPPILVLRGEGHLSGHVELELLEPDGSRRPLGRHDLPEDGSGIAPIVEEISLAGEGFRDLIADLGDVGWLNSTGLGWLVGLVRKRRAVGGSVALAGANPRIMTLLETTALALVLPNHDTVEDAARALWSET